MAVARRGRSIQRLTYVDAQMGEHTILLAYLGGRLVWDGTRSQVVQIPHTTVSVSAFAPVVSADSLVDAIPFPTVHVESRLVQVSASSAPEVPFTSATVAGLPPELFSNHILDIPRATVTVEGWVPEIQVIFGVTPPVATVSVEGFVPDVLADSTITAPTAMAHLDTYVPVVGSFATIEPNIAAVTVEGHVPDVSAGSVIEPGIAAATVEGFVPNIHAGSVVEFPAASATVEGYVPEINALTFARQRMVKVGEYIGSGIASGWSSDPSAPATIVNDTHLVVQGSGEALLQYHLEFEGSNSRVRYIHHNGVEIHQLPTDRGPHTAAIPVSVEEGDTFHLEMLITSNHALLGGGWIEVTPE